MRALAHHQPGVGVGVVRFVSVVGEFAIMQHLSGCDGNAIFRISSNKSLNLDQFLSTSDQIWLVSDEFKVLTSLGGGPVLTVPS